MKYVDLYLCSKWNEINISEKKVEENFWDFCRILEKEGYLSGDDASVTTISIGPFRIVSQMEIERKNLLSFFLEIVVPALLTKAKGMQFDQVYALYLLPAANLFLSLASHCYWIKDLLQWEILMYIEKKNNSEEYPTIEEIKNSPEFSGVETWQIDQAIEELKNLTSILGDKNSLIKVDHDGRLESLC